MFFEIFTKIRSPKRNALGDAATLPLNVLVISVLYLGILLRGPNKGSPSVFSAMQESANHPSHISRRRLPADRRELNKAGQSGIRGAEGVVAEQASAESVWRGK